MTVSIIISGSSGGNQVSEVIDSGTVDPGDSSSVIDFYIRHDAENNPITDCGLYLAQYVGDDYTGVNGADNDYIEVLSWGDTSGPSSTEGEGLYFNQNHSGGFPTGSWSPFRSSYGSDPNNAIQLLQTAINNTGIGWTPTDGEIPVSGEAHIKCRWDVPLTASSAGARFVLLVMAYSYTS